MKNFLNGKIKLSIFEIDLEKQSVEEKDLKEVWISSTLDNENCKEGHRVYDSNAELFINFYNENKQLKVEFSVSNIFINWVYKENQKEEQLKNQVFNNFIDNLKTKKLFIDLNGKSISSIFFKSDEENLKEIIKINKIFSAYYMTKLGVAVVTITHNFIAIEIIEKTTEKITVRSSNINDENFYISIGSFADIFDIHNKDGMKSNMSLKEYANDIIKSIWRK